MTEHLWTGQPPPWEYIELILCRDVYHCTPSQLREEDFSDIMATLAMLSAENQVREARNKKGGNRTKYT